MIRVIPIPWSRSGHHELFAVYKFAAVYIYNKLVLEACNRRAVVFHARIDCVHVRLERGVGPRPV